VDEKARSAAHDVQRKIAEPNQAAPPASAEVTTALDPAANAADTDSRQVPGGERPAPEAETPAPAAGARRETPPTPIPDKSPSFLQRGTRPGSLGRLGHFEVLELLGKGGFGIVLKAWDETLERLVAIKVLGPQLAGNANARARFVREARAAAAVKSKHVVGTYAVEEQPIPYLVMEYVAGQTLQHRIDQLGPLQTRDVLRIGAEIAEGLAAAHKQGLIHRDIKPANILLEDRSDGRPACHSGATGGPPVATECRVKIADFGLARAVDDASLTQSGVIAGTPMFMSPEQARGETLDHRSDLFSLGSVLYTLCTGQPPFRANKTLGILKRVCDDTPRPIREINPDITDALAAIVNQLLVKDPAGRFQTAAAVAELLRQHLAYLDDPSLAPPPGVLPRSESGDCLQPAPSGTNAGPPPEAKARPRRRTLVLCLAAACVLLMTAGSLLLFLLPPRPSDPAAPKGNPDLAREQSPVPPTQSPPTANTSSARAAAGAAARGDDFARRGQWAQAAKEALAEVAANPAERMLWSKAAPLLLLAGDLDGYRQLCGRMIEQFSGTTSPEQADSVCKVCLLLPGAADRSKLPSQVLVDGVEQGTARAAFRGYFCAGMALIAYRDGRFEQAVADGGKSLAVNNRRGPDGALALLVVAMAQHQLRQAESARQLLTEATALIPYDLATLGSPEFQGTLPVSPDAVGSDWLIAEVLRREAALLIHGNTRRPPDAAALRSRGLALFNQGKHDEALAAFRQALELEERHGWTHYLVGVILVGQEKSDEAIPEFRRAIEVAADYAPPYASLGVVLAGQGKTGEAIPLVQKAVELDPKFVYTHGILGELLLHQGKLDEAVSQLNKLIERAPQDASALQLRADALRLRGLLPKLNEFVDGTAEPADNGQRLDLARLCLYRQRYAAAARFYAAALDADPKLADDPTLDHRYSAACAAARAAHGDGDGAPLDAAARARLRKQAVAWLRAELEAAAKPLPAGPPAERTRLVIRRRQLRLDADLASLRDADEVGKLPDGERALLKTLWSDLDAALRRSP
jgi:serine/threonine protein kinase/tetratricopeptide (TPR) repeat protein